MGKILDLDNLELGQTYYYIHNKSIIEETVCKIVHENDMIIRDVYTEKFGSDNNPLPDHVEYYTTRQEAIKVLIKLLESELGNE
jgi:hypothetical protein